MGALLLARVEMEERRWIVEEGGIGCLRSEEAEGVRRESLEMGEMTKMVEEGEIGRLV